MVKQLDGSVPKRVVADWLMLSERHVAEMASQGLIPRRPGPKGRYDLKDCVQAYIEVLRSRQIRKGAAKTSDLESDKRRKAKAEADIKDMEDGQMSGELIRVESAMKAFDAVLGLVRSRVVMLCDRTAPRLIEVEPDFEVFRDVIRRETYALLEEIDAAIHESPWLLRPPTL